MVGRACGICSSGEKLRIAAEMIAAGASDQAVAVRLGIGRSSAQRHRTLHVVKPAQAVVEAAGKGREVVERRAQVLAAAERGDLSDPTVFLALHSIVGDLRTVHERLERTAAAAEEGNQRLAVSALSSQQLRAAEVRAKMGGIGGYAPQKVPENGSQAFVVNINLGDRQTTISAVADSGAVAHPGIDTDAGAERAEGGGALTAQDAPPEPSDPSSWFAQVLRGAEVR